MKPQFIQRTQLIDDQEVTIWSFTEDGIHEINLNNLLDESVWDCMWLDDKKTMMVISYTTWNGIECMALVSPDGEVHRKGIYGMEAYNEEYDLMIISIFGWGLGEEGYTYHLEYDDYREALIGKYGSFVMKPVYDSIVFDEEENCYIGYKMQKSNGSSGYKEDRYALDPKTDTVQDLPVGEQLPG